MVFFEENTEGMKWVFFSLFFVNKSIGNNIFFIIDGLTNEQKITNKRFIDKAFPSIILLIN